MKSLKALDALSGIELFFVLLIFLSGLLYLHFFLDYSWNKKQLKLLDEQDDYNLIGFGFWGMTVCVLTLAPFFSDKDSQPFVGNVILLLVAVVLAKYYYFKSLRKLLKLPEFDKYYLKLIYVYLGISTLLFIMTFYTGTETFFDTTQPTESNSLLRNIIIPYELQSFVKVAFLPNFIFCFVAYFYLIYKSYRRKEYLITFGVCFTLVAIAFTNSYHLLQLEYWMPLNVIADVFELLRLNIAQKYKISKSIEHKNQALIDLITIERSYEELNNHHNTFKHDLANNLFKSKLNLQRANTLLNKENFEADKLKMTLKRALQAQEVASDFFNQSRKIKEFSLKDFFDRISDLFEIKVILKTDMLDKIRFNTVDFNNIFTNLIKNAQEATSHSKETWVKVYFEHCEKSKAYKFKVIDSGDFNKIKNKERIFEEGVSSKGISDRGLGLYSVRKIIKKYNGEIVLESVNNHTCFSFSLETTI